MATTSRLLVAQRNELVSRIFSDPVTCVEGHAHAAREIALAILDDSPNWFMAGVWAETLVIRYHGLEAADAANEDVPREHVRAAYLSARVRVSEVRDGAAAIEAIDYLISAIRLWAPNAIELAVPACRKAIEALTLQPPEWQQAEIHLAAWDWFSGWTRLAVRRRAGIDH